MFTAAVVAIPLLVVAAVVCLRVLAVRRLARIRADAAPSLDAIRAWQAQVEDGMSRAVADGRWISRDTRTAWLHATPAPSSAVEKLARVREAGEEARQLLAFVRQDLSATIATTNERIRTNELVARRGFLDSIEKQPLTTEQASAVVTFDNRVQVIAAAGSGKTSVMVARAAYSILKGVVPAERILLLAFNKDAAAELQERVGERLGAAGIEADGLVAATFHSFGLSVIGRATGKKPRLARWLDGGGDIEMVSRIVDELRDRSLEFRFRWDLYRLLFARMGAEPDAGEPDAYDRDNRRRGFRTFNGEAVKSQGERMIADFLFLNGVDYQYEAPYEHDVADPDHSQYRPDFFYPDVGVWHEHWALDRDGNPPAEFTDYAASMDWKRGVHHRFGTALIETTWAAIIDQSGFQPLAEDLKRRGLTLDWNPDRPLPDAAPVKHDDLARLMRSFLAHVKSNSLTRDDLERRLASSRVASRYRTRIFLDLFWQIHDEWQARLGADHTIDFEDMLVQAAEHLEAGRVDMGRQLVLVDEFQDASRARVRLARALVDKPHRYLLAVGDDWQSINRFAGADLSVMTSFDQWFGEAQTLRLQTTFRSPQAICDAAGGFVSRNPRQARKQVTSTQPEYGAPISLVRVKRSEEVAEAVVRVLDDLAGRVRSGEIESGPSGSVEVDVLGRYRFDRPHLPRTPPRGLTLSFRTVHAAKGLEADYVILPNVMAGVYGFPSEIVDDPVLALAMTEADPYPYAEERRMFYVALTRARRQVTMIGVEGRESGFVAELLHDNWVELSPLSTADIAQPCPTCRQGVLVVRTHRATRRRFLGCNRFPGCTFTRSLRTGERPTGAR